MASLGYYLLLAAFVVCAYAAAISVGGARRRSRALIESGVGAFYLVTAIMAAASAVIVYAFVTGDYSIKYVQRYSDSTQPLFYKLTSYWGGLDGSIMFWVSLLSVFGCVGGVRQSRAPSRAHSLRRGGHLGCGDVLPLPDDRAQQPVLDLPHAEPDRRRRTQSAAAELLHGDSPADDVSRGSSASPFRTPSAWPR